MPRCTLLLDLGCVRYVVCSVVWHCKVGSFFGYPDVKFAPRCKFSLLVDLGCICFLFSGVFLSLDNVVY